MERTELHVRLPADLAKALAAKARKQGISLNAQITIALREWLARREKST